MVNKLQESISLNIAKIKKKYFKKFKFFTFKTDKT